MESDTKLYINIKTGEISIEGSESFVSTQANKLEDMVSLFQLAPVKDKIKEEEEVPFLVPDKSKHESGVASEAKQSNCELIVPPIFGEWLQLFKDNINDQDTALITAYYVQQSAKNNDFKTAEINKSLLEHGIKLANTSTTLKQIEKKKWLFQTRKVGRLSFKRVSTDGILHLKSLMR